MEFRVKAVKSKYGTYGEISMVTCNAIENSKNVKRIAIMGSISVGDTIWVN